ncbi:Alpha-mannosidase [Psidium guajava]|nr:Alpha-mannosidase [Psidium guajava]
MAPESEIDAAIAEVNDLKIDEASIKEQPKAAMEAFHRGYIFEEHMSEIECSCLTPEIVLKASGHVNRFTDLMVKDGKAGACYRADHLLKYCCNKKLQKDLSTSADKAAELKQVLVTLDDLSADELGAKIKGYGITAPAPNPLSRAYLSRERQKRPNT